MNLYLTGPAVAFVVNAVLAILVFRRAPRDHAYRLFSLMALLVSLWGLLELLTRTSPDMDIASAWQKLTHITFAFVAALFFNFSLSLNDIRLKKSVLLPLYGSAALLAVLSATDLLVRGTWLAWFGHSQILGPLFPFYALYTYFLISLGIVYLLRLWNNSRDPGRKNQAAYIILAFTALAAGRTADYLALFGTQNYPLGVIGATVFALVTAWSILKHRLMNINFVIRKSLVFLIPLLFITGTSLVLEHLVPAEESGIVPHLVVLLVVILFFLIFAPQAQIFVDRVFYRKRYKHLQALYRYTGQTRTLDEINAMPSSLASLISSALDAGRIFLFVYSPIQEVFVEAASSPLKEGPPLEIPDGSPLILQLKQREGAFPIQDAEGATTDLAPYPETLEIVKRVGASVLLPLTIQEELVGVLTLGNKKTGKGYSQEDIELMNEIAPRLSLSLKNYQLYTMETRRLEEVIALRRGVGLIMKELDVKAIMDRAVGEGARLLGVPAAAFAVLGGKDGKPEDNYFRIETSFGLSPEFVRQTRIPLNSALRRYGVPPGSMELKIEASGDITIQPSDPGRTYPDSAVIEDIPSNPVGNPDLEAEENLSSALILPIITSRGFLGTLVFFQKSPVRRFTKYLRELARSFADSVAVALEKARLYELEKEERLALKKIEDQRQLFLSAITHELRTPITSMKLSTDLLAEELEASELSTTRRLLANIHRSVDSLNSRIDDLVRFVRLNAPDLTINKETVSLQLVVKSALDLCQPFFTQKKQVIVTELPASLPPVMADRFRLEQILSNLLLNAGKFTPEGSTITLRAAVPGNSAYRGSVLVEIEDCGVPGIAAEDIENIFEPFSRGRGKTVTGLGLGLTIARRLVNVHGGRIWAESQPGVKTVFYFTLPLATTGK